MSASLLSFTKTSLNCRSRYLVSRSSSTSLPVLNAALAHSALVAPDFLTDLQTPVTLFSTLRRSTCFRFTVNKSREIYVDREILSKQLDAYASPEERVLLALYRVAGLRSSEALLLTWGNVDFEARRLIVLSPKTERIDGKEKRVAPLFPQLRRELIAFRDALGAQALDKESRIISQNQRYPQYTIKRVLTRANLPPYPRLVQNLRSSASIDIYSKYGEVAESAWLGHTSSTAQKHYLHVLESDYEKATLED